MSMPFGTLLNVPFRFPVLQRVGCPIEWPYPDLLRLQRHPVPRRGDDRREAGRLLQTDPARPAPLRRLRATADRPDPPEPGLHACKPAGRTRTPGGERIARLPYRSR